MRWSGCAVSKRITVRKVIERRDRPPRRGRAGPAPPAVHGACPSSPTWTSAPASLCHGVARVEIDASRRRPRPASPPPPGRTRPVSLAPVTGSAQQVDHAAMAERGRDRGRECRRASHCDTEKIGSGEIMAAPCVGSWPNRRVGRAHVVSPGTDRVGHRPTSQRVAAGMNVQGRRRTRADRGRDFPEARWPITASIISSPIPAPTFRRSSRPSRAPRRPATRRCRSRCWCRTRTSRSRWRTAPI